VRTTFWRNRRAGQILRQRPWHQAGGKGPVFVQTARGLQELAQNNEIRFSLRESAIARLRVRL